MVDWSNLKMPDYFSNQWEDDFEKSNRDMQIRELTNRLKIHQTLRLKFLGCKENLLDISIKFRWSTEWNYSNCIHEYIPLPNIIRRHLGIYNLATMYLTYNIASIYLRIKQILNNHFTSFHDNDVDRCGSFGNTFTK